MSKTSYPTRLPWQDRWSEPTLDQLLEPCKVKEPQFKALSNIMEGIEGYEFDEAWEDYRHAVLYQWVYATVIAGTLDATNERGNAWMAQMVKRNTTAIDDLGCLDLLG